MFVRKSGRRWWSASVMREFFELFVWFGVSGIFDESIDARYGVIEGVRLDEEGVYCLCEVVFGVFGGLRGFFVCFVLGVMWFVFDGVL